MIWILLEVREGKSRVDFRGCPVGKFSNAVINVKELGEVEAGIDQMKREVLSRIAKDFNGLEVEK